MKNRIAKRIFPLFIILCLVGNETYAQKIQWFSFEQALDMNARRMEQKLAPKKIFVDVYTDWCGWCKKLDATTFSNSEIIKYMSENYIAVKLNAERTDTVVINGQMFVNSSAAEGKRGSHDLAAILLKNKMSYPSCTFIDETGAQLEVIPGYRGAKEFEILLHFFGENAYKTTPWEEYKSKFVGKIKE
ncbi:MAG: DUF255 domain-containing protein [Bacteroidales bacterium]